MRALLRRAGAPGADPAAIERAFVHESAAKESVEAAEPGAGVLVSNQRLEFLGDAALGHIVARSLYERYPAASEGELTLRKAALVSDVALARTAERLGFEALLVVGKGYGPLAERPTRSMLADAFEAFVAALVAAAGFDAARGFVEKEHVLPSERAHPALLDPKTELQQLVQRRFASVPAYADRFEGPPHERTFTAKVWVNGEWLAEGTGLSKKEAQQAAAARALELLAEQREDARV